MLGNINSKFKNAKAAIKKKQEELSLKKLKDGVFPYACLVADDVMLTKNGEVFQMIEILLDDFKDICRSRQFFFWEEMIMIFPFISRILSKSFYVFTYR